MHNKSFTVDRAVTIVGGRNVAGHYYSTGEERQFADFDVIAAGPAAGEVVGMFERYWQSPVSIPIHALLKKRLSPEEVAAHYARLDAQVQVVTNSADFAPFVTNILGAEVRRRQLTLEWAPTRLVSDLPEKVTTDSSDPSTHLIPELRSVVNGAQREVFIVSPYFVPGKKGVAFFQSLRARGIRVVVLSNSLAAQDVPLVHTGYRRYRKALLRAGVELWEIKPDVRLRATASDDGAAQAGGEPSRSALHAKTFAFDRNTLFVGSLNLTPRSSLINTEMGLMIDSSKLTASAVERLEKRLAETAYRLEFVPGPGPCRECGHIVWHSQEDGREVRYTREPHASFSRRLQVDIFSLLPIESQL
jgi:putative cardiolipin synthase